MLSLDKCIVTFINHLMTYLFSIHRAESIFTALKIFYALPIYFSSSEPYDYRFFFFFTVFIVLPLAKYHIVGSVRYIPFSDWLLSLSNMYLRFFHVSLFHGLIIHLFLALNKWMDHSLFIHSPAEGHLGLLPVFHSYA